MQKIISDKFHIGLDHRKKLTVSLGLLFSISKISISNCRISISMTSIAMSSLNTLFSKLVLFYEEYLNALLLVWRISLFITTTLFIIYYEEYMYNTVDMILILIPKCWMYCWTFLFETKWFEKVAIPFYLIIAQTWRNTQPWWPA